MPKIILQKHSFSYLVYRKSIRSIRLQLKTKRSFYVSCPFLTPAPLIGRFIRQNQDWIIKNSQKIIPQKKLKDLKKINILGQTYNLLIQKNSKPSFFITTDTIYLTSPHLYQKDLISLLKKHLQPLSKKLISSHTQTMAKIMGVKYRRLVVKNQRSLFGSCSHQNNLNFNWQIIFFPKDKFDHILIHELAHLKHRHHQKSFWSFVAQFDPNWQANNRWLKNQGSTHYLFKP